MDYVHPPFGGTVSNYVLVHIETNGLPHTGSPLLLDAVLLNHTGAIIERFVRVVTQPNDVWDQAAEDVHGVSLAVCIHSGEDKSEVVQNFNTWLREVYHRCGKDVAVVVYDEDMVIPLLGLLNEWDRLYFMGNKLFPMSQVIDLKDVFSFRLMASKTTTRPQEFMYTTGISKIMEKWGFNISNNYITTFRQKGIDVTPRGMVFGLAEIVKVLIRSGGC